MIPKKDVECLIISWNVPYSEKDFKTNPLAYFGHLLGHEGENSICSYLRKDGYITSISSNSSGHRLESESSISLSIDLTKNGLANYEKVLEAVFQYNQNIRDAGPQDFVFEEKNKTGKMSFKFLE